MPSPIIPLFAEKPHPSVPLGRRPAGARSEGQGRPPAGASRAPFTEASTLAGWRRSGGGSAAMVAVLLSLTVGAMPLAAQAQDAPTDRSAAAHPYASHVTDASRRFGLLERWIWAVMHVESRGNSRAVSRVGAMGLMQIMPATWASLRARHGLGSDPYDVRDNIMAGAAYLRAMHDRYGNATAMLAAYNAGPGRYDEYLSRGRPLPTETLAYLEKLASITGGADDSQLAVAPSSDPLGWRRAALFAVRPRELATAPPSGDRMASNAQPERPTDGRPAPEPVGVRPPSSTLFVTLSGRVPQ